MRGSPENTGFPLRPWGLMADLLTVLAAKSAVIVVHRVYFCGLGVGWSVAGAPAGPGAVRRDPAIPIEPGRRG